MSLPEPGQPIVRKEETTIPAVVKDAGQFVSPTVPSEVAHIVAPISPMPAVSMPPEVTQVGEGVPVATGQEAETPPTKKLLPFKAPNLGILGLRAAGSVRKWNEVRAEHERKKQKLRKAA